MCWLFLIIQIQDAFGDDSVIVCFLLLKKKDFFEMFDV
jgi:hypothetical protein